MDAVLASYFIIYSVKQVIVEIVHMQYLAF